MESWVPFLSAVVVAIVAGAVSLLNARNARAIANLEADLLKKLEPDSQAAKDLNAVIEARVNQWYRRAYKIKKTPAGTTMRLRQGREIAWKVVGWASSFFFGLFLVAGLRDLLQWIVAVATP